VRVEFDGWLYDGEGRQLLRGNQPVHLSPKAFELLGLLLARRPAAVPKAELKDALWPKTFVEDANLPSLVAEVRTALRDDPRQPRFVRTVQRFGYAFCGTPPAAGAPAYCLIWGSREIPLAKGETLLGRARELPGFIDSSSVSRRHARVVIAADGATIEDLDSKNGTFVGERRISTPTTLRDGDRLRLGTVRLVFKAGSEGTTATVPLGDER
jgi:FHA domain-containing protein